MTEGTDRRRGYNETLAYGAYTGGDVHLVGMTLQEIDTLQTKMLKHPANSFNSSALGRYQIVRTTLRTVRKSLSLPANSLFDSDMQDRCACYLLGLRGIDKYLAGRLSEDTLIDNLAREWASLPTTSGKGAYAGQNAAVTPNRLRQVLAEVKQHHYEAQPAREIVVEREIDKPVVPVTVEAEIRKRTDQWSWITTIFGSGGAGLAALAGMERNSHPVSAPLRRVPSGPVWPGRHAQSSAPEAGRRRARNRDRPAARSSAGHRHGIFGIAAGADTDHRIPKPPPP